MKDLGHSNIHGNVDSVDWESSEPKNESKLETEREKQLRAKFERSIYVLRLIAESAKRLNKNAIVETLAEEKLGTEPTARETISSLEEWGMIRLVKTKKTRPGGKTFNYYRLTKVGLENLITAAFDAGLGQSFFKSETFQHLARKYQDKLPSIFGLWDIFTQAGIDNLAWKQLLRFLIIYHGRQLETHVYGNLPDYGLHGTTDLRYGEYECTPEDDVEAFLEPDSKLPSDKWRSALQSNGILRSIFVRSLLKQAKRTLQHVNSELNQVPKTTTSNEDSKLRKDLFAEMKVLRSKIAKT